MKKQIDKLFRKFVKFCRGLCNFVIKLYLLLVFFKKYDNWRECTTSGFYPPFFFYLSGYIPNCCEALEAMLAASSIGAVWSSTSPDFGVQVCGWLGQFEGFFFIEPVHSFKKNPFRILNFIFYCPLIKGKFITVPLTMNG